MEHHKVRTQKGEEAAEALEMIRKELVETAEEKVKAML